MSMEYPTKDLQGKVNLGIPSKGAKEGYLLLIMVSLSATKDFVMTASSIKDPRLVLYIRYLISLVTDKETRQAMLKKLDDQIEAIQKDPKMDAEERGVMIRQVSVDMIGELMEWFDEFLGVTHTLEVGTV